MSRRFLTPSKIPRYLFCPICNEVFTDASVLTCGHTFCKKCIQKWLSTSHSCPICRKACTKGGLGKDSIACKLVDDLQIVCMNNGCNWSGMLKERKKHDLGCLFHPRRIDPCVARIIPEKIFAEDEDVDLDEEHPLVCSMYLTHSKVLKDVLRNESQVFDSKAFQLFSSSEEDI